MKFPDFIYGNIGRKLKIVAYIQFVLLAVLSVVSGIALIFAGFITLVVDDIFTGMGLIGLLVIFLGPITAYFSSWIPYAFAELVENSTINAENTTELVDTTQQMAENIFVIASNSKVISEQEDRLYHSVSVANAQAQQNEQTLIKQSQLHHQDMMSKLNETAYNAYVTAQNLNILADQSKDTTQSEE